ncbi:MAG: dTDP-glucose 4,6-dehydratase, partial [Eubacteriales bacterium]
MNLLITGGAGFIGSNFIRYILQTYPNYLVINYDSLTYAGSLSNISDFQKYPNYFFIKGDIRNKELVAKTVLAHKINCIINFAAETHVDRSISNPTLFVETNVCGTCNLLEAALKYHISKYIQISSDEVYGSSNMQSFTENSPLLPNSPYSASKAGADVLVRSYNKTYDLPVNIVRSSNNYGQYQHTEKFIPKMITNALKNKPLPLYGDGLHIRDWLHVRDNCSAIDLVLHKGLTGEIYNIGGCSERTNLEVAKYILKYLRKSNDLINYTKDRLGHDRRYSVNCN